MADNLRHLHLPQDLLQQDAVARKLANAGIASGTILDPPRHDPRLGDRVSDAALAPVQPGPSTPVRLPRPAPGDGLRLIELAAFHWGGPSRGQGRRLAVSPRVRGDHVLIQVTRGILGIELPRMRHLVDEGRIAFVPAGTAFALQPPDTIEGCALLIPARLTKNLSVVFPASIRNGLPDPIDQPLLRPALLALGHGSPRNAVEIGATTCQLGLLSIALSRLLQLPPNSLPHDDIVPQARLLTEAFLGLATAKLSPNQTISELAHELDCSVAQLDAACRQSRGRSALELLYAIRLQRASELLRTTAAPIEQIAQELGYSSVGHFTRMFVAATGHPPEGFRAASRVSDDLRD